MPNTRVTGRVELPDGTTPANAYVRFQMSGFDTDAPDSATVVPRAIDADIDASGNIDVSLWPNQDGVRLTYYRASVVVRNPHANDDTYKLDVLAVPSEGGPYDLNVLLAQSPPEGADVDQYIASLAAAVAAAENAADRAEAAADTFTPTAGVYATRAEAEAALVPVGTSLIWVVHDGIECLYKRDPSSAALTTADGSVWGPAAGRAKYFQHWGGTTHANREAARSAVDAMSATERTDHQAMLAAAYLESDGEFILDGWVETLDQLIIGDRCVPDVADGIAGEALSCGVFVTDRFNMSAPNVIQAGITGAGSYAPYVKSISIALDISQAETAGQIAYDAAIASDPLDIDAAVLASNAAFEAALPAYPIPFEGKEAFGVLENMRVTGMTAPATWIGPDFVSGSGNPDNIGGWEIRNIQLSGVNRDLDVRNGFHFVKIGRVDDWIWDLGPRAQDYRNRDVSAGVKREAIYFGRMDSLLADHIGMFQGGQIVFDKGDGNSITDQIGNVQLDGDGCSLTLRSGRTIFNSVYGTEDVAAPTLGNKILCEDGTHLITSGSLLGDADALIHVTGGRLEYNGVIREINIDGHGALVTGGQLVFNSAHFVVGVVGAFSYADWNVGYLQQSGAGELVVGDGCTADQFTSGGVAQGPAVQTWLFTKIIDNNTGCIVEPAPRTRAEMVLARSGVDYCLYPIKGSRVYPLSGDDYLGVGGATSIPDLHGLVPAGDATPSVFGATSGETIDVTDNLTALTTWCQVNGRAGRVVGSYVVGGTIVDRTGGLIDWSNAVLNTTAEGQTFSTFSFAPTADKFSLGDTAAQAAVQAVVTAGDWVKGVSAIPSLGAYAGRSLRVASSETHMRRFGNTDYRYEVYVYVIDGEGNLSHPLPFDIPSTVSLSVVDVETVGRRKILQAPIVRVGSGNVARTAALLSVTRSNTVVTGGGVINDTGAVMSQMVGASSFASCSFQNMDVRGAKEVSTQYGFNVKGVGHTFIDCLVKDCRRGLDGTYASHITVSGGAYSDGIGGHWIFSLAVDSGAVIGCDAPNNAPIHLAGADVSVADCVLSRTGEGAIINQRQDSPEVRGEVSLTNCRVYFDLKDETGTVEGEMVNLDHGAVVHDFGRDLHFPDAIRVMGNTVNVSGTGHTGRIVALDLEVTRNNAYDMIVNTDFTLSRNSWIFANGSPNVRIAGVRRPNWSGGGIKFNVSDAPNMSVFWGAVSGHTNPTDARADWDIDRVNDVDFRTDPEATRRFMVDCQSYTTSDAAGQTSSVGDEDWWFKINGSLPFFVKTIADDTVHVFAGTKDYEQYSFMQRNGGASAVFADWITDQAGTNAPTIKNSGNATFTARSDVLTGTTGADGNFNISQGSGLIYLENRTGSSLPLKVLKVVG